MTLLTHNTFFLFSCAQAALFSLLVCVLYLTTRRIKISTQSTFLLSSLFVLAAFWGLIFLPTPKLFPNVAWDNAPSVRSLDLEHTDEILDTPPQSIAIIGESHSKVSGDSSILSNSTPHSPAPASIDQSEQVQREVLEAASSVPFDASSFVDEQWQTSLTVLIGFILAIGIFRFLASIAFLRKFQRSAEPIDSASLIQIVTDCTAVLGLKNNLQLLQSESAISACTFGWRKPKIMLPAQWRDWSTDELSSVIAHEVAHVAHRDFLWTLLSRFATTMHFYNPLVHWLAANFRRQLEFKADSTAIEIVGDRSIYVASFAKLALNQNKNHHSLWITPMYLPTRHALIERLNMLTNPKKQGHRTRSNFLIRCVPYLMVGLSAVVALGFQQEGFQQQPAQKPAQIDSVKANLKTTEPQSLPQNQEPTRTQESKQKDESEPASFEKLKLVRDAIVKSQRSNFMYRDRGSGVMHPNIFYGNKGTIHSWRVLILPYIGHQKLFDEYRLDEAWDSKHNQKVTSNMPDVFRHPSQPKGSTNTSIAVASLETVDVTYVDSKGVSKIGRVGLGSEDGYPVRNATFGIPRGAKTLLPCLVEADTSIHWAAPKDIEFKVENLNKPGLGGVLKTFDTDFCFLLTQFSPPRRGWEQFLGHYDLFISTKASKKSDWKTSLELNTCPRDRNRPQVHRHFFNLNL